MYISTCNTCVHTCAIVSILPSLEHSTHQSTLAESSARAILKQLAMLDLPTPEKFELEGKWEKRKEVERLREDQVRHATDLVVNVHVHVQV